MTLWRIMLDAIGIGLIGYGMIGRVHTLAYRELPDEWHVQPL